MEAEKEEEGYTLTSFRPLSPEVEKSGLRKFIAEVKSKTLRTLTKDGSHDSQAGVEKAKEKVTQVSCQNSDVERKVELRKKVSIAQSLPSNGRQSHGNTQLQSSSVGEILCNRHTRTPSSVLRRLSQLVLLERSHPMQQRQSTNNLKKYWMPDEQCKVCYECGVKFNTFRRRHHCRLCGQIFCSRCCNEVVSGPQIGYTGVFRVCIYCKKIVLTYTSGSDIEKNLNQLKRDLSLVAQPDTANPALVSLDDPELNRSFDVLGVSAEEANLLKQDSFKDLWKEITTPETGLLFLTHRMRLRSYSTCFAGRDLINWLMLNRKAPNRSVALQICQGLLDLCWIEPLSEREPIFQDDMVLYIPGPRASGEIYHELRSPSSVGQGKRDLVSWLSASFDQSVSECRTEGFHRSNSTPKMINQGSHALPSRVRSLSCETIAVKVNTTGDEDPPCSDRENHPDCPNTQSPGLDVFVNVEDCYLPKRLVSEEADKDTGIENDVTEVCETKNKVTAEDLRISSSDESDEHSALQKLSAIHDKHISAFLVHLLDRVGLSQSWKDVIESLAIKVCEMVVPNPQNEDEMDLRHYVKIKKTPGGLPSACRIVSGVVCTKNVVHKKMAPSITQPHILMLACPVDFQRVENKMASLDSLVLQEKEFLKNMVARIVALKPSLVLVEKTVSRLAQDMLFASGISLIININPKLMARISRCVEADVLPSLDQGSRPKLGTCREFKIEKFVLENGSTKTLAFFEGCNPSLGATIVLRGAHRKELTKVKNVLRFMVFVAFNSKLEKAFIMDEFGTPFVQEEDKGDHEITDDNSSLPNNKVTFSIEGDEQNLDVAATRRKSESCTSNGSRGSSKKASETSLEESQTTRKESDLVSGKFDADNNHTNCLCAGDVTCDLLANVVNGESFQKILDNVVLCSSPLVKYPLPYVLSPEGQQCELLEFTTGGSYWSPLFFPEFLADQSSSDDEVDNSHKQNSESLTIKETHPFVFAKIEKDGRDLTLLGLLASYRAEGGRIVFRNPYESTFDGSNESDESKMKPSVLGRTPEEEFEHMNRQEITESGQVRSKISELRDCFHPFLHQMIAVMFSSYSRESANFPRPCITPWTLFMEFYARNDLTLGCFLERYCFRSSYVCPNPNCDVPMVKHVRYFAHGDGAVYINMKNLESPIPGYSKTLLTWSWCKICKQVTPVVPVSAEAWMLSFAKYLELRMYATCYRRRTTVAPCDHSLHQDHYQYFAFNNIVASLKYVPLNIYQVRLPPLTITIIEAERKPQFWIQHIQAMSVRVYQLVNLINDRIALLKTESYIADCVSDIAYDKGRLDEKIKVLDSKAMLLLSPTSSPGETEESSLLEPHEVSAVEYEILDGITLLKRKMCEYGKKWNAKLVGLLHLENEKKKSKSLEVKNSNPAQAASQSRVETVQYTDDCEFSDSNEIPVLENSGLCASNQINPFAIENTPGNDPCSPLNNSASADDIKPNQNLTISGDFPVSVDKNIDAERENLDDDSALSVEQKGFSNNASHQKFQKQSERWATLTEEVTSTLKGVQYVEDRPDAKMKRIIFQLLPGVNFRSIPSPFPVHEHHMLPVSDDIPIVVNEKEPTSIIAYTLSSPDYQVRLLKIQESMKEDSDSFTYIDDETDGRSIPSDGKRPRTRTRSEAETMSSTSLMNTLEDDFVENYFQWSELDEEDTVVKGTLGSSNQERLGDGEGEKVEDKNGKVKIEETGQGSRGKMSKTEDKKSEDRYVNSNGTEAFPGNSSKLADNSNTDGKESLPNLNSSGQDDVEYHIKHSFSDSSAKFFCIVYFGEQFRRIRKVVFPGGEEKYVRSLQYCLKWQVTGGKSGSSFCKTTDDRFVVKEMSRPEAQSFLNIAPYYFQYIEKAIQGKRPTLLAKILGVYRIGYNSKLTNTPVKKDLLVMDNLLYNCKVDQIFDLKGSIRSRYVNMSREKENYVLLDENLSEMIAESPLFIRPHSKAVLFRAINNDTEFLAEHMVMDYSLLLGIEQNSCKLIVGIIDFIRTFTWDKKLEMYVKSTGILGGQGKMPTVVSPELYRERFCEAMQRYFLMIPNKWMGLASEVVK